MPESVRKHLEEKNITLRQVMTHKGDLGDYLPNYTKAIANGAIPVIDQPEDFISFVDLKNEVSKDGYSNVGILLVGLAIKHACGDIDYNKILEEHLLKDADISCSSHRPHDAVYNKADKIDLHVVGGPSGGYWMTVEDLGKFGKWLYEQSLNPKFEKLMRNYGQEFYYPQFGKIAHDGRTHSANAHFAIYLKDGIIVAVLSDQPDKAVDLGFAIKRHIFCDRLRNERLLFQDIEATNQKHVSSSVPVQISSTKLVAHGLHIIPSTLATSKQKNQNENKDDFAIQTAADEKRKTQYASQLDKKATDDSSITYYRPGKK